MSDDTGRNGRALQVTAHGIILKTERFEECVRFYRDILELPVWFEQDDLTCLRFGDGYLMIETGGMARDSRKLGHENPTILRLNVVDVGAAAAALQSRGVAVDIRRFSWGVIGAFVDPDGNACELKNAGAPFS
ncbi:VOC family protein [Rhizobium esperanzae]|uniref:Lactoylglutathione lyase n=1 Tax=Rhizobium esperanzae TaxID=1967781 RepID=A0A7W6W367_9HYPH|nr:VOC family protein [Rhizobium esperanzae]MBB4234149.1 lactoylglutathione lyase [Rhizobium esperanzae]